MEVKRLTAEKQLDSGVGFRFRRVLLTTESSKLHCHEYYELFLTLSDGIRHQINGREELLPRGALLFIRKDDRHHYPDFLQTAQSFINLSFSEEILTQLFTFLSPGFGGERLLAAPFPPQVILSEKDIAWVTEKLDELNTADRYDTAERQYQARMLLLKIFTRYFPQFRTDESTLLPWLRQLDRKMRHLEHFSQGVEHMVRLSGKSREHLCRSLKKHFNKSASEYLNDLRLNYLANSLVTTNLPIIDLCYTCGFENTSWAYTLFKRKYGTSPAKFRKNG
ncbi:MAG: helix-turn-helix domain-containing protein [Ruminococcaceae bacterium]|nr:helix-turn-helix domain-containing protein [Oscillospiraceae bacterium]